ncbi:MAG: enoyl-CoA hydratase-related protein [Rhodospirillales bacterium]
MSDRYAAYSRLKFDRPDAGNPRILRITLDRPERLNALDAEGHREITGVWRDIDADPEVDVVILRGAGKGFSSGGDFEMIEAMMADFDVLARTWKEARDLVYNLINCGKPIVSAIHGPAVGAGLVCALLADISIAAKSGQDRRWPYAPGRRRRRSRGNHLAAVVRHGEGQVLPVVVRADIGRRSGAHRAGLPLRRRFRAGGALACGGAAPGVRGADGDTLEQVRAQ